MDCRRRKNLWSTLDDVVWTEYIRSEAELKSDNEHDEQADDRRLQKQNDKGELIIFEQFHVAHGEQHKLLQRIATLFCFDLLDRLMSIATCNTAVGSVQWFKNIFLIVFRGL